MSAHKSKPAKLHPQHAREATTRFDAPKVGHVVSAKAGVVQVDFEGNRGGPRTARVSAELSDEALAQAARDQQDALLVFDQGDAARPVLVALLRSATPMLDAVLSAPALRKRPKVARLDGERVELEARDEVVLRCGPASLTLSRDGTIRIRGVNVVTQAEQKQKIRGGKVEIN